MPSKVDDVHELEGGNLLCRDLQHAWNANGMRGKIVRELREGEFVRVLEREVTCDRCATTRVERISLSSFQVLGRKYEYPDGYLVEGGNVKKVDVRSESIRRMMPNRRIGRPQ